MDLRKGDRFDTEHETGCVVIDPPGTDPAWTAGEFMAMDSEGVPMLFHTGMVTRVHPTDREEDDIRREERERVLRVLEQHPPTMRYLGADIVGCSGEGDDCLDVGRQDERNDMTPYPTYAEHFAAQVHALEVGREIEASNAAEDAYWRSQPDTAREPATEETS